MDEAKIKCVEIDECAGITRVNSNSAYELRKGTLHASPSWNWGEITWMKSFIQWSDGHDGKYLAGHTSYGSDVFSVLDDAKNKCIELIELGDPCGGITQTSDGFQLRRFSKLKLSENSPWKAANQWPSSKQ